MMEKTISSRTVFTGRLLKIDVLDVELADGTRSVREIVRHPGAAAVLAQRGDGKYVFVRQFRKPVESIILEIVAGTLDPGETVETCAVREIKEEIGYDVDELVKLGEVYPAPGYTDEKLHLFYARLADGDPRPAPEDDERLDPVLLDCDDIEDMIATGAIHDAKTLSAWQLYCRRDGLGVSEDKGT